MTRSSLVVLAPPLLFALISTAGCEEDPGVVRLRVIGEFDPATIAFGEVPIGMTRSKPVLLKNTGAPIMTIDSVEVPEGYALTGVKGRLEGIEIVPGSQLELEVAFLPMDERAYNAQLVVKSGTTDVILELSGAGVRRNIPLLAVEPAQIEFGSVAIGTQARRSFNIVNTGTAPGVITEAILGSTMMQARASDTYAIASPFPINVAVGGAVSSEVLFAPSTEGAHADTITFVAADHGPVVLSLNGTGLVPAGDILCTPASVDFGRVERGMVGRRDVVCTAQGGPSRFISAMIQREPMFVLVSPPSTRMLAAGESVTLSVEFRADGLPGNVSGDLVINYDGGTGGGARNVSVDLGAEVTPPPPTATAMSVVLDWNRNNTDVDLHLVRPGGMFYDGDGDDCHWRETNPDWGSAGVTTDDPFLDVDDTDGFGPETINLESAAPGSYQVHVHYYGSLLPLTVDATAKIYIAGTLATTVSRNNMDCDEVWYAGDIQWNGTSGTFMPRNTISTSGEGACF